jgi:thiamine pyrophosphate-dependent acetolactate synthase large subunit-like protein
MKAHDVVKRFLYREDVDVVFSLMSDGTKKLISKLHEEGRIDVVETRHEQHALGMADGYARVTGDIGVCMVGRGPAIAQTGTSLVTSARRGSNVLLVVPETPLTAIHDPKDFPQERFLETLLADVVTVSSEQNLVPHLQDVFRRLRQGDGPIALQVPWDILDGETDHSEDWEPPARGSSDPNRDARVEPAAADVETIVDLYLDSDASVPPVILAGRGAVAAGAREALESLAERTSAILLTTLQARGLFADHDFAPRFVGTFGTTLANRFFTESDFVYAVGCSLNPHTTDDGRLLDEETTVVHVDTDPAIFGKHYDVDLGVYGDARETTAAVDAALADDGIDFSGKFWTANTRRKIENATALDQQEFPDRDGVIDPRDVVRVFDEMIPEDRLVIADGGHFLNFVLDGITISDPADFVWTLDFSSIGQGLPVGLGAALSAEDRACFTFCGDAGFQMVLQELETAVREDAQITIVVMDDEVLGSEYHQLDLAGMNATPAHLDSPSFEAIAEEFGATGYTAASMEELDAIRPEVAGPPEGPTVVHCKVDRNIRHRFYQDLHGY